MRRHSTGADNGSPGPPLPPIGHAVLNRFRRATRDKEHERFKIQLANARKDKESAEHDALFWKNKSSTLTNEVLQSNTTADLFTKNQQLTSQLDVLSRQYDQQCEEFRKMETESKYYIQSLEQVISVHNDQKYKLDMELFKTKQRELETGRLISAQSIELMGLRSNLAKAQAEAHGQTALLIKEKEEYNLKLHAFSTQKTVLESNLLKIKTQLHEKTELVKKLEQRLKEMETEKISAESEYKQAEFTVMEQDKCISQLQRQLSQSEDEKRKLNKELTNLAAVKEVENEKSDELEMYRSLASSRKNELLDKDFQIQNIQTEFNNLRENYKRLQKCRESAQKLNEILRNTIETQKQQYNQQNSNHETELKQYNAKVEELKAEMEHKDAKITKLKQRVDRYKEKSQGLEKDKEMLVKVNTSMNEQSTKIVDLESQIKYYKQILDKDSIERDFTKLRKNLEKDLNAIQSKLVQDRVVDLE